MKPEDSIPLRVAVTVAVVAACVAVLREGVGGPLLWAAVLVGIPAASAHSYVSRHESPLWPKVAAALGAVVVLLDCYDAVQAVGMTSAADLQLPLAELLVWMQVLHALDLPGRRNVLMGLLASLVLVAVAGVLSLSLAYGTMFVVWGVAAAAALVFAHRSELADLPALWTRPRRRPTGALVPAAVVVTAVAAGASLVFALLPAAGSARALTFPAALPNPVPASGTPGALSNPSLGNGSAGNTTSSRAGGGGASFAYTGFSTQLDTAVRGRPDDTLVMRVRASAPSLWRGQTFDRWDGRRWTTTQDTAVPVGGDQHIELPIRPEDVGVPNGDRFVQTFYLEQPGPNLVFGAYAMTELYFPDRLVFVLPDGAVRAGVELDDGAVYTVVSRRPPVTEDMLRAADFGYRTLPRDVAFRNLQLSAVPQRVQTLAAEITAGARTRYDAVQALTGWMAANTQYTLDIPPLPPGADAVDHFLFEERRGFCEQIASALVVMLRSLGVPARVAVGYAPGERNPFTGLFEVRARDAHAWAEVYFDGIGWQGFDPTAEVPLAGDSELRAASGLLSFLAARLPSPPAPVAVTVVVVPVVAWLVARRRSRRRAAKVASWAAQWQQQLDQLGRSRGRPRRDGETLREYAAAVRALVPPDPAWRDAVELVEWEAYGGAEASADQRTRAEAVLSRSRGDGR